MSIETMNAGLFTLLMILAGCVVFLIASYFLSKEDE